MPEVFLNSPSSPVPLIGSLRRILHPFARERKSGVSRCDGCRIRLVSSGPELIRPADRGERDWKPMVIAAAIVIVVAAVVVGVLQHGRRSPVAVPVSATPDAYAANLPITNVQMSESGNLAGGKVTYIDGHIANKGARTVIGITVQTLFRNVANEVAQNEVQPMQLVRTREPYVDVEPVSAAPLKPGDERDFRLAFDSVTPDWNSEYPQLRILHVQAQ